MRYEDMMKDTERELKRISEFLDIPADPKRLRHAVESSSADRMRALEKLEEDNWVATKNRRKDIPFVRVAKSGGWHAALPAGCVQQIENAWGGLMTPLGYELGTTSVAEPVR
jgi:hypothetical protein